MAQHRRRVIQTQSLNERLLAFAKQVRARAAGLPPGIERDQRLKKAREADTASHIEEWVKPSRLTGVEMKDLHTSLEKLRKDAAEAALIRDLATDKVKREMYDRLHVHFSRLADEVEQAMKFRQAK